MKKDAVPGMYTTVVFEPTISPFVKLMTKRSQMKNQATPEEYEAAPWWERLVFDGGEKVVRDGKGQVQWSAYPSRFLNSLIIAISSTVLAVGMGTFTQLMTVAVIVMGAVRIVQADLSVGDMLTFLLCIAVLIDHLAGLNDSHIGLIILYVAFNLSFSVWLMKGFMDEIPKEYEEAALVDGYTRLQAFFKIVLPEATTGIAATAVFCFITAWNEYAFALIMTNRRAQTAPPFIPSQIGSGLPDWTTIAAGTFLFLLPVAIFTFLLRNHLLRGMSFGAICK
jgi:multiple sugar transport system permease protein